MTAYSLHENSGQNVYSDIKRIRLEMGYSIGDMAACLGIPRATYQHYESGLRKAPAGFVNRMREWQQIDLDFMADLPRRVDESIERNHGGIVPNIAETWE